MSRIYGSICDGSFAGRPVRFFVTDQDDEIMRNHARGEYYEIEELAIIAAHFPPGGVFVDIGTNIGNHTIYVCNHLHPMQVIAIEPNPAAIAILRINLALNGLQRQVDLSHLGVGLAETPGMAQVVPVPSNLGGAHLLRCAEAEGLQLIRGDDILQQRRVDFIKLDVECMEMEVLAGLEGTIAHWRPAMFIEVSEPNSPAFQAWVAAQHYVIRQSYRRYPSSDNHMVVPVEAAASLPACRP